MSSSVIKLDMFSNFLAKKYKICHSIWGTNTHHPSSIPWEELEFLSYDYAKKVVKKNTHKELKSNKWLLLIFSKHNLSSESDSFQI